MERKGEGKGKIGVCGDGERSLISREGIHP